MLVSSATENETGIKIEKTLLTRYHDEARFSVYPTADGSGVQLNRLLDPQKNAVLL